MMARLLDARRRGDDSGFALIFTLLATTMAMIGVAAVLSVVTPNIGASRNSEDAMAAMAAARSGVDDLIAYLVSVPSCRSETKVCTAALGASSTQLNGTARQRPSLGTGQKFVWTTNSEVTADGYLRVTSKGTANGTSRTITADLSLQPSILAYGYYSDYESLSPQFLSSYYNKRSVYLSDASIFASTNYTSSNSVPRFANWESPTTESDCGQHWYRESASSPGRASNGSNYDETGRLGTSATSTTGTRTPRTGGCDLVFSPAMVQDGKTFTRDALLSSGAGPKFNQPVYTMWGYDDADKRVYTTPAPTAGKNYRGDDMTNTPNLPAIAPADLVLPKSIGTDGIAENACVYTGPTRVLLTGDGKATVTSPSTRTKNAGSDSSCYPPGTISSTGVVGWTVDYRTVGGGTLIARNSGTVPSTGWPANPTKSINVPGAGNEVFYLPASGSTDVTKHTDSSTSGVGCTSSVKYSAAVGAACAWTNLATDTDATTATGWTGYTTNRCSTAITQPTNRQSFECEYGKLATTATPTATTTAGYYKTFRDAMVADLATNSCLTGTADAQAACINALATAKFTSINNSARRYVATSTAGTPVSTAVATGSTATSPTGNDPFFVKPTPAKEELVRTPITTTITRETYDSANNKWVTPGTPALTFTTTQSDYTYTAARGASYFPNPLDITMYNTGTNSSGAVAGSAGVNQPGDLYVDGANKGKLSLVADNDVIVTGNITNPTGYTPDTDALSIAAARDVRNYHPVKCADQDATDITNTTPGWCPNDITGLTTSSLLTSSGYSAANPAKQYVNMAAAADRNIEAAVFALSGSFRTDNYNRADAVGALNIKGGVYQSFRGGNGVVSGSTSLSGTTLQYKYVDLQRAELPYVPPASSGNYSRPWDVVSISAGSS